MGIALKCLLGALGLSALLIAGSIIFAGAVNTADVFEAGFDRLTGWSGPGSGPWAATMDSELRFYAAIWAGFGGLLLMAMADPSRRRAWTPALAGVFFLGGVGRLLSAMSVGPPHPLFRLLMWIELLTPPGLITLWWLERREHDQARSRA
jgi:hypothetical protein